MVEHLEGMQRMLSVGESEHYELKTARNLPHTTSYPETLPPLMLSFAFLAAPRGQLFRHMSELGEEVLLIRGNISPVDMCLLV